MVTPAFAAAIEGSHVAAVLGGAGQFFNGGLRRLLIARFAPRSAAQSAGFDMFRNDHDLVVA
ncbi:MAG: hypothetical protein U1E25_08195 [Methylocystis sp.]